MTDFDFGNVSDASPVGRDSIGREPYRNPHLDYGTGGMQEVEQNFGQELQALKENVQEETEEDANNLRFGGNHLRVPDPNRPGHTPFYLMVTGHLQ